MSQGRFSRTRYLSNNGTVHPIRVQPETLAATIGGEPNTPPGGAITSPIRYLVNVGSRQKTPRARGVYFEWVNSRPDGYEGSGGRIPIMSPTVWDDVTENTVGLYLGQPINVTGKYPELPL